MNSSGGWGYQLRAIIHKKRWAPFCDFVENWLMAWAHQMRPQNFQQLVLIGPNAGYTLSNRFVSLFDQVIVVEPDPLAYVLFEARFMKRAYWIRQDYFDLQAQVPNPNNLRQLFQSYPNATFLFCNILGQIPVLLRERNRQRKNPLPRVDVEQYMLDLGSVLSELFKAHKMASYHDRYSRSRRTPNEVIDHLTGSLFATAPDKKESPWAITAREEHQIEFVRN